VLDLGRFDVITFDCYGTLIDWETGILEALASFRTEGGVRATDDELLAQYAILETLLEGDTYIPYREVLRGVMRGLAAHYSVPDVKYDIDTIAASIPAWRPFPDTVDALRRLKQRYRLGVISNIDDDLFAGTARVLEVPFDVVVTAQQAGAYKPSHQNFEFALERIGVPRERVLHAAQSRFHDVAPARALGIASVWVNRRKDKPGDGATAASNAIPDLEVPDLETLAALAEEAA